VQFISVTFIEVSSNATLHKESLVNGYLTIFQE